jgi:16S rRNA (adenine1518-N6/adenine1519-N6)-dimethyltransferase
MKADFWRDPPTLAEVIRTHALKPDKSLGQHFLLDPNLLAEIVARAGPLEGVNVIEIGPGPGGLTRALLNTAARHVTAIEYDPRAAAAIAALAAASAGRLTLVEADALKLDVATLAPAPRAIVANLPYNIGTLLLTRWLAQASAFTSLTLMFQREVAERICAPPNTAAYGRLSVLTQWLCDAHITMHIPAHAFSPPPKVDSALIHITPKPNQPSTSQRHAMERLTAAAFGQRRKMLRGALRALGGETLLNAAHIAPDRRAETLTVEEFVRVMEVGLSKQGQGAPPLGAPPGLRPGPH